MQPRVGARCEGLPERECAEGLAGARVCRRSLALGWLVGARVCRRPLALGWLVGARVCRRPLALGCLLERACVEDHSHGRGGRALHEASRLRHARAPIRCARVPKVWAGARVCRRPLAWGGGHTFHEASRLRHARAPIRCARSGQGSRPALRAALLHGHSWACRTSFAFTGFHSM